MTDKELINQYVTAHADNRWMDASELETLLTEFAEKLKEPSSEGLEEASKEWLRPQLDKYYAVYGDRKMMELTHFDGYAMLDAIEFGAQWQKEQFMKGAIEAHVNMEWNHLSLGGFAWSQTGLDLGDKCKLIIIKE